MIIAASSLSWIAEPLPHARYSVRNSWDESCIVSRGNPL